MNNIKKIALFATIFCFLIGVLYLGFSLFQNKWAKQWGGTITVKLPANTKLETVTWKDDHLWHLTRPMRANEEAETYTFKEDSAFGVLQGTVLLKESKQEVHSK